MRQGQNNPKRSRGRGGRNNGRPQNSANRAYDSNGPDVKIRGTATHVCEKYQQLARDAISAGDRVMAENYFQHAEHYYRLLMAAQAGQEGQARPQSNLAYRPPEDEEEETDFTSDTQPQPRHPGQPWHQQNGNGQGGGQNASPNGGQGGGQVNGGQHRPDNDGDDGEDDDRQPDRQAAHQQGGEGEGQPRRRQGRRRRPRGEGQMNQGGGEPRRAEGGHEGGEAGGDDVPRAEAPSAPTPEVAPGD